MSRDAPSAFNRGLQDGREPPIPRSAARGSACLAIGIVLAACGDGGGDSPVGLSETDPGSILVEVSTRGTNLDPDGYSVSLDGRDTRSVPIDGKVAFQEVPPGVHGLTLNGLAANCYGVNSVERQILVAGGTQVEQRFAITCMGIPEDIVVVFATLRDDPDGRDFELYGVREDGSGAVNLTNHPAVDYHPAWSPDGTRLAFSSWREDGAGDIYVVNADGTGLTRLTETPGRDGFPAWSPDGARIAFVRGPGGLLSGDLWVMNADGSAQVQLTNTTADEVRPTWSPDGTRIAFERAGGQGSTIVVMDADGSDARHLLQHPDVEREPAWSPDGTRIAFRGLQTGDYDLWTADVDGSNLTRVRALSELQMLPAWSPDGDIVFSSDHADEGMDIFVISADGGVPTRLTTDGAANLGATWKPPPP